MPSVVDLADETSVRALADARGWEHGVALADADAVTLHDFGPLRVTATVNAADGAAEVELRGGEALACACGCTDAPEACRHVVAAAIETWRRAPKRAGG
jgi:uncharacterized Zn finger protein